MHAADLLVLVRRRAALTQAELAKRARTSQPVVSAYEHGKRDPGTETLGRLVAAAGQRLELRAVPHADGPPPPTDPDEHGRRLLDVLSLTDAVPARPRGAALDAPRLVSR